MAEGRPNNSQLLLSIKEDLENLPTPSSSAFIYRVPKELRDANQCDYTPSTISIGPLHAGASNLEAGEQLKKQFFKSLLCRFPDGTNLERLIQLLKGIEDKARQCYAEKTQLSSDEYVKMMLLDGCFILELLEIDQILDRTDPVFTGRATGPLLYNLKQDLLLLENQLPLFVLKALSEAIQPNDHSGRLIARVLIFFGNLFPVGKTKLNYIDYASEPRHLLELVLFTLFPHPVKSTNLNPNPNPTSPTPTSWNYARTASELELYGVDFKTIVTHSLSDVRFSEGALTIPTLVIQESTASLFKNLLALEQCSDEENSCFTSYLVLMDTLINTEKDVERLLRAGILETWFNDRQALASLFNSLTANVAFYKEDFPLGYVFDALNEYCSSGVVRLRAHFMRYYYESRWDILITILLFILTVTQTLFSILSYNPKNKG